MSNVIYFLHLNFFIIVILSSSPDDLLILLSSAVNAYPETAFLAKGIERNQEIFLRFLYEQKKCFGVDFNDLINFAVYILEKFPDVAQKWQDRIQYIMVDEFQDVSAKQYSIAQILSRKHKNLFIVGDSDQTIYSWRGRFWTLKKFTRTRGRFCF